MRAEGSDFKKIKENGMLKLFIFNFLMIAVILLLLWVVKRFVRSERGQNAVLIGAAVATVLLHYSMFFLPLLLGRGV